MGRCLAHAALKLGHHVTIVSGPVEVSYPESADVIDVVSTEEMLEAAKHAFRLDARQEDLPMLLQRSVCKSVMTNGSLASR